MSKSKGKKKAVKMPMKKKEMAKSKDKMMSSDGSMYASKK